MFHILINKFMLYIESKIKMYQIIKVFDGKETFGRNW